VPEPERGVNLFRPSLVGLVRAVDVHDGEDSLVAEAEESDRRAPSRDCAPFSLHFKSISSPQGGDAITCLRLARALAVGGGVDNERPEQQALTQPR
jgi:hypothetical protein